MSHKLKRMFRTTPARQTSLKVLYEDNHCLAVDKPAGVLTAGDRTGDVPLLELAKQFLKQKYRKPGNVYLGLVHRLDRPVSGVVLFARTSKAARRLTEQFRAGRIRKTYRAWVHGLPEKPSGELIDFLLKDRKSNVVRAVREASEGARRAVLEYRVLRRVQDKTLLEIRPQSGRPHQIRVQLASRGWPILGDAKYGGRPGGGGQIALHASQLSFEHPVRQEPVTVYAPEPELWVRLAGHL